jgi:hypothetical protein
LFAGGWNLAFSCCKLEIRLWMPFYTLLFCSFLNTFMILVFSVLSLLSPEDFFLGCKDAGLCTGSFTGVETAFSKSLGAIYCYTVSKGDEMVMQSEI